MHPKTRKECDDVYDVFESLTLRFGGLGAAGIDI
jgi:hypothetical protein